MGPTAVTALIRCFWILAILLTLMTAFFLTQGIRGLNSFARPWGIFETGVLCIPILISGGLRLWLHWLRHPWAVLIAYSVGLFFAFDEAMQGIFLSAEWCLVFQIVSAILFALYFPWLIRVGKREPEPGVPSTAPPPPPQPYR